LHHVPAILLQTKTVFTRVYRKKAVRAVDVQDEDGCYRGILAIANGDASRGRENWRDP
jgi:hypothetical protein